MDGVTDAFKSMKTQRIEHSKYQILKTLLEDESCNLLDLELKEKLKSIMSHNLSENLILQGEIYGTVQILGVSELLDAKLTHEESTKVSRILQKALDSKYLDLCNKFKAATDLSLPNEVAEMDKYLDDGTSPDSHLLNMRSKIVDQQERYLMILQKKQDLLERLAKQRLEKLPEVCESKVKEYDTITRLNSLKTQIVREKTRTSAFTRNKGDFRNYEEIINGLKERMAECTRNIESLKDLKKSYNQSAGKQYDDILKLYTQYKTGLEKKQLMIGIFQK